MAEGNYSHRNGALDGAFLKIPFSVSASTTSGVIASQQNPEGPNGNMPAGTAPAGGGSGQGLNLTYDTPGEAVIGHCFLVIRTPSSAACTLDIGTAADGVTLNDNLFDGTSVAACPANTVYDNFSDATTNAKSRAYLGPFSYVNVSVASGNANGLVAELFVTAIQTTGGP